MDKTVLVIFSFVYVGMILGRIPALKLDRTGVALLGAIALLAFRRVDSQSAWDAVDVPTIGLLFGLMVVSAQFRLAGFYTRLTRRLAQANVTPDALLALLVAVSGALSAVLANDIVCLAVAPVVVEICARRRLDPVPFLLGLACAANVGSAATLIGNPQNMLVGQTLRLSFAGYLRDAAPPALLGLIATWWIVRWRVAGRWQRETPMPDIHAPPFNPWQATKGLAVLVMLMAAFLFSPWPREVLALAAAGVLLTSRRMHSREMLGLVDWQLLVLFIGLFIVNHALEASGALATIVSAVSSAGVDLRNPGWLFVGSVVLSNVVSNVPAVMLLLPLCTPERGGPLLAISSTLAGNLFLVGSIANLIVVDQAAQFGVRIGWREHARVGIPVALVTLALAGAWLAWLGA